jgi:hypothetical protein
VASQSLPEEHEMRNKGYLVEGYYMGLVYHMMLTYLLYNFEVCMKVNELVVMHVILRGHART